MGEPHSTQLSLDLLKELQMSPDDQPISAAQEKHSNPSAFAGALGR